MGCCDDLEQIPLNDSSCHFFRKQQMTLAVLPQLNNFLLKDKGFLSENRCLAGDDLYLGKFKDDSMPISRSHKRAAAGGGTRQKSVIFH